MNLLAALLIAENVRQRAEQGDCPKIPAQPVETLENVILELQRALARDAVAGAIVDVVAERDAARKALRHYGRHERDCEVDRKRQYTLALPQTCGCGLEAALSGRD
jgi:hypothetical protein